MKKLNDFRILLRGRIEKLISKKLKCVVCGIKLKGRQMKYCSEKCADRQNYLNHKEHYIENAKKWRNENPEKAKEISRKSNEKWREKDPERYKALIRSYYHKDKAKWRARSKAHYLKNRDKILKKQRENRKLKKEGLI